MSGKEVLLPAPPPLRTVRASFDAYSSSIRLPLGLAGNPRQVGQARLGKISQCAVGRGVGNRQLHVLGDGVVPLLQPDGYHHLAQGDDLIVSAESQVVARPPSGLFQFPVPLLLTGPFPLLLRGQKIDRHPGSFGSGSNGADNRPGAIEFAGRPLLRFVLTTSARTPPGCGCR
jgi:hypothetical protein